MTDVMGRTAFITGGAQGIGLGVARAFAAAGARLALADLDATKLTAAGRELAESTDVATFQFDVRDRDAFARAADAAEDRLGPVSVLVNNAGVGRATPLDRLTYEVWDHVLAINLGGDAAAETGGSDQLFDRFGLSPEIVGEQVLRGVRNGQLYVHTDRMLAEPIRQRTKALLDAMPPETERDRELAAVFEAEILAVIQRPLSSGGR